MAPVNRDLINRYIQGKASPEEEKAVLYWLDHNDIEDYEDVISQHSDKKVERNWARMVRDVEALQMRPAKRNRWLNIAAISIGILLLGGITGYLLLKNPFDGTVYQTTYGEIKKINLKDGTIVTLNAESTLRLKKRFNAKNRDVFLEGEAFFEVKHKAASPFKVHTGKISVTALGTSFDVSAFSNAPDITVALKEGKVLVKKQIRNGSLLQEATLAPGEEVVYQKKTANIHVTKHFNEAARLSWQKQIIYFKDADLQEVVGKLERFYGVTIDTNQLKNEDWQLTGTYKNQTLKDVLESLHFNYNLNYKVKGKEIILFNKK